MSYFLYFNCKIKTLIGTTKFYYAYFNNIIQSSIKNSLFLIPPPIKQKPIQSNLNPFLSPTIPNNKPSAIIPHNTSQSNYNTPITQYQPQQATIYKHLAYALSHNKRQRNQSYLVSIQKVNRMPPVQLFSLTLLSSTHINIRGTLREGAFK